MKRTLHILSPLLLTVTLTAALSGCGFNLFNGQEIVFGVNPAPLGYELDSSGRITIESRTLTMHSRAGALGATVNGYRTYFFDGNDEPVPAGDSKVFSEGALGIYVPAGIRCDAPDLGSPPVGCYTYSEGARYEEGYQVLSQPVQLLPVKVATQHIEAGFPLGWYAEIELYGTTDTGANFITDRFRVAIVPPN